MSGTNQPCGCHDPVALDVGNPGWSDLGIPSLDEFEQKLQAISSGPGSSDSLLSELDLAGLDASLGVLDDLSLDMETDDDPPALADLLRLLERFPGLKLTLSY